jgi:deoxyribonuclease-4
VTETAALNDLFGAHISISGGAQLAPARAEEIGSRWMQIFTKQPQRWVEPVFSEQDGQVFRTACETHGIQGTTVHASYLINVASPTGSLYEQSINSLTAEYRRCTTLGASHLVLHPGAATDGDRPSGVSRLADALVRVLEGTPSSTAICLEITTGKGSILGNTFEELALMLRAVEDRNSRLSDRVAICLDTCHLYAAGYDITNSWVDVTARLTDILGLHRIRVWHLNDSQGKLGSSVDRHAWIGEGHIGEEGFRHLVNDDRFRELPMLLETPKNDDATASDRRNLAVLRRLRTEGV